MDQRKLWINDFHTESVSSGALILGNSENYKEHLLEDLVKTPQVETLDNIGQRLEHFGDI